MVKVRQVKAWETTREPRTEALRESVVASVVAGLEAAQLSQAELLAVVAAIHAWLAQWLGVGGFVLTATAIAKEGSASSRTVQVPCSLGQAVTATIALEHLAKHSSPELWAQIERVMTATDEQLAEMARGAP